MITMFVKNGHKFKKQFLLFKKVVKVKNPANFLVLFEGNADIFR